MSRAVVNVSTGSYVRGQQRMQRDFACALDPSDRMIFWTDTLPTYSPIHADVPYAFKAWALKAAHCVHGVDVLLWCDSSIVPGKRPMKDLWAKIEKDGYWISRNNFGQPYSNYEWTADSSYYDLFPVDGLQLGREINRKIPHVCATAFGLDMRTTIGKAFLDEYLRLAQTDAFKGPWINELSARVALPGVDMSAPLESGKISKCGPLDVRGHRHDQSAASVIAWRLGMELSQPPQWIAYDGQETEETCLVAVGI